MGAAGAAGASTGGTAPPGAGLAAAGADGALAAPTCLAFAPDGRMFVGELEGAIRRELVPPGESRALYLALDVYATGMAWDDFPRWFTLACLLTLPVQVWLGWWLAWGRRRA